MFDFEGGGVTSLCIFCIYLTLSTFIFLFAIYFLFTFGVLVLVVIFYKEVPKACILIQLSAQVCWSGRRWSPAVSNGERHLPSTCTNQKNPLTWLSIKALLVQCSVSVGLTPSMCADLWSVLCVKTQTTSALGPKCLVFPQPVSCLCFAKDTYVLTKSLGTCSESVC